MEASSRFKKCKWSSQKGLSLVELMVAVGLLVGLLAVSQKILGPHLSKMFHARNSKQSTRELVKRIELAVAAMEQEAVRTKILNLKTSNYNNQKLSECLLPDLNDCLAWVTDGKGGLQRQSYPLALTSQDGKTLLSGTQASPKRFRVNGSPCPPNKTGDLVECPVSAYSFFRPVCKNNAASCEKASSIEIFYVVRREANKKLGLTQPEEVTQSFTLNIDPLPTPFNTALMGRDMRCLFCHIKVEGDVGGIDMPASAAGSHVRFSGNFYTNGAIPPGLKGATSINRQFPFYNNKDPKIFPNPNPATGILEFPHLAPGMLVPRMRGKLECQDLNGNRQGYYRTHNGNVVCRGAPGNPILIDGEVFINGDLVIHGPYNGIGTIYAQNIFVVNELTADTPVKIFPFAEDPSQALLQARSHLQQKLPALYLGALNQILVGDWDRPDVFSSDDTTTYDDIKTYRPSFIDKGTYESFGKSWLPSMSNAMRSYMNAWNDPGTPAHKKWLPFSVTHNEAWKLNFITVAQKDCLEPVGNDLITKNINACNFGLMPEKLNIDVYRVDAHMFAQNQLIWVGGGNWVSNGGITSPRLLIASAGMVWSGGEWCGNSNPQNKETCPGREAPIMNPYNEQSIHTNIIRYDYRLRAGGPGFESLKILFKD